MSTILTRLRVHDTFGLLGNLHNSESLHHMFQRKMAFLRAKIISYVSPKTVLKFKCSWHGYEFYAKAMDYWRFIEEFEPRTTYFIHRIIDYDDIFIDVGAHIGFHTIHCAKKCKLVIALEPEPQNFYLLKENIKLNNLNNVIALPIAASDNDGYAKLYISNQSTGAHTLEEKKTHYRYSTVLNVRTNRLDTLVEALNLNKIDIIKIDVEGHETKVIKGMKRILSINKPRVLIIEVSKLNFKFIFEYLSKYFKNVILLDKWDNERVNMAFIY